MKVLEATTMDLQRQRDDLTSQLATLKSSMEEGVVEYSTIDADRQLRKVQGAGRRMDESDPMSPIF